MSLRKMSNFAQKTMVISFMTTKKYILAYFRRKSMYLGSKKYTSRIEVSRSTPVDSMVPPHLQPQYSKKHPQVDAKNRDSLREISREAINPTSSLWRLTASEIVEPRGSRKKLGQLLNMTSTLGLHSWDSK